ncbi:MAG: ATP-grasp domain-containing protein [Bdellovibrionales bacterium]|nr:ATP-grasp domain-containing protein [Bdellovibrionales bacterium]
MTARKALKILIVIDLGFDPPADHDYSSYLDHPDWRCERDVFRALKKLGHEPRCFGLYRNLDSLVRELVENRPDLVFNLCESYSFDREQEPNVAAVFEMLAIPYTGCGSSALRLCKDKAMTKELLCFRRVGVPAFVVWPRAGSKPELEHFPFPAIVKPLGLEASEGITSSSLVRNASACARQVRRLQKQFKTDVIIEEYIHGREITVGMIGDVAPGSDALEIFEPREVFFEHVPEGEPRIASFRAKWDERYRKRWGIDSGRAAPLPAETLERIQEACRAVHQAFRLKGYARVDFRVRDDGQVFFLEANPNPSIARKEDFAAGAAKSGYAYPDLLERVLKVALG